jgi:D-alanyl-D-alanine-carboxypeptidase/D-alanyl-D-alanine-endopeptidase
MNLRRALVVLPLLASTLRADPVGDLAPRIDRLAAPLIEHQVVVGMTVGVYRGSDGVEIVKGYGRTGAAEGGVPDADTVYEIGSITKVFTGTLLAALAGDGTVKLDQAAAELLPEGVGMPERDGRAIRLVDLATHTSGLPRMPDNFHPRDPANPFADYTVAQLYDFLEHHRLEVKPGLRFEYSNLAQGLLGHLLGRAAGTSWTELVRTRITAPLGMKSTVVALDDTLRARLAPGHDADGRPVPGWDIATLEGAGALRSTARDMLVFLRAELAPRDDALGRALVAAREIRFREGATRVGLGWHASPDDRIWWHNGQTGGYHSFAALSPDARTAVVVLANSAVRHVDDLGWKLAFLLAGQDPEPPAVRAVAKLAPADLERLVGTYRIRAGVDLVVTLEDGRLLARLADQPKFGIYPESRTRFYYRVTEAYLTFRENERGEVTGLVLEQHGQRIPAARVG